MAVANSPDLCRFTGRPIQQKLVYFPFTLGAAVSIS